ncbi:lipase family protein [Egbenema bharatensis]|uniref:lipase family protein n=1 Tax=Egbenema bharatensis TaxID=3463334 RepID=UPI003A864221
MTHGLLPNLKSGSIWFKGNHYNQLNGFDRRLHFDGLNVANPGTLRHRNGEVLPWSMDRQPMGTLQLLYTTTTHDFIWEGIMTQGNYSKAAKYAVYCQEVYQNFSTIRFGGLTQKPILIDRKATDTQCAILPENTEITIVFRGSESSFDWDTNFASQQERAEFDQKIIQGEIVDAADREKVYPYPDGGSSGAMMHRGFVRAYFSVRDEIHDYIKGRTISTVITTGHSLGGALATLCAIDIQYNFSEQIKTIESYTFGSPKVGNDKFRDSFNRRVPKSYRFVHGMDIVAELPRWWQGGYHHVDKELRIGRRLSLNFLSDRFKDHAIARYIEVLKSTAR